LVASATSASPIDPGWADQAAELASRAARQAFSSVVTDPEKVRVEVIPGAPDPRLRLAPCAQVEVYPPAGHRPWGRTRIGLRCVQGPVAWNISVPLTVKVWAPALVTTQALSAGTVIDASHLAEGTADWAEKQTPVLQSAASLVGRTLAVAVAPGTALGPEQLRQRKWFDAGDAVRIVAVGTGFAVAASGEALSTGVEGRSVRVRTPSGRTVTGTATGPAQVEIRL
jgi:flagella basal body P-ring formation protein FlgA